VTLAGGLHSDGSNVENCGGIGTRLDCEITSHTRELAIGAFSTLL